MRQFPSCPQRTGFKETCVWNETITAHALRGVPYRFEGFARLPLACLPNKFNRKTTAAHDIFISLCCHVKQRWKYLNTLNKLLKYLEYFKMIMQNKYLYNRNLVFFIQYHSFNSIILLAIHVQKYMSGLSELSTST